MNALVVFMLSLVATGLSIRYNPVEIDEALVSTLLESSSMLRSLITVDVRHTLSSRVSLEDVVVKSLQRFAADQTSHIDYAMGTLGGFVASSSTPWYKPSWVSHFASLLPLGIPPTHPADVLLRTRAAPGECLSFPVTGYVELGLSENIAPTAITFQHAPLANLPPELVSAVPKSIKVSAGHTLLVNAEYSPSPGNELVTFPVLNLPEGFATSQVRVEILSNHGNSEMSCLHRVRVHGVPA